MFKEQNRKPNRLIKENSPYLLQHAYNPVDWYPWGVEAFEKAEKDDKPIFLSIGYSTCHWCHVMERESFEDPEVAEAMNAVFISIKVDREERPDIDKIYMKVCQMMTGSGGWPLTIIMTTDKNPFFAGTYIPKQSRYGRLGMLELVSQVKNIWEKDRRQAIEISNRILSNLRYKEQIKSQTLDKETLRYAYLQLLQSFDHPYGGFSKSPKFPIPHNLLFLLRYWKRTREKKALQMVEQTLRAIRIGGVYDHIGFGVHRYSTDRFWRVPHFEKMLYDQALLSMALTETYQATGNEWYRRICEEILEYVLKEMTSPEGGFYSAEDADSEGVEGKFYLWVEEEIRALLTPEEAELIIKAYNVSKEGNYLDELKQVRNGRNILYQKKTTVELASELGVKKEFLNGKLEQARKKLLATRNNRVRPLRDDKILLSWNGLMIAALAKAGRAFKEQRYVKAASKNVEFVESEMISPTGSLKHRYRKGEVSISGFLDDYAFLVWGLLELYETAFEIRHLKQAIELNKKMVELFWDEDEGGFYFTSKDSEELIHRSKDVYDGAKPSGNSVAILNLLRLSRMTANSDLEDKATALTSYFSEQISTSPMTYTLFLAALDFYIGPSYEVVVTGSKKSKDTEYMLQSIGEKFLPNKIVLHIQEEDKAEMMEIANYTESYKSLDGRATAYVCKDFKCNLPTVNIDEMLKLIE